MLLNIENCWRPKTTINIKLFQKVTHLHNFLKVVVPIHVNRHEKILLHGFNFLASLHLYMKSWHLQRLPIKAVGRSALHYLVLLNNVFPDTSLD